MKHIAKTLLIGLLPVYAANADGLRCGAYLLGEGDRTFEVSKACGEPDIKVVLNKVLSDQYETLIYDEEWQYNFGPQQLMRFVRFRNGKLTHVETGPHGFTRPAQSCKPGKLSEGLSVLEMLGLCGEPMLVERRIAERSYGIEPLGPFFPAGTQIEEWIYEFGQNRYPRVVTVIDGKVISIEKTRHRN